MLHINKAMFIKTTFMATAVVYWVIKECFCPLVAKNE